MKSQLPRNLKSKHFRCFYNFDPAMNELLSVNVARLEAVWEDFFQNVFAGEAGEGKEKWLHLASRQSKSRL